MVLMIAHARESLWGWIFRPAARYPADPRAVFILAVSVFAGLTALALKVAPQSLEALLPTWGLITWGVSLTIGSALTLIGMAFQSVNGVVTEQLGSVIVGAAVIFYSGLAFWSVGISSIQSVGIILAWGLACLVRWAQLQALLNTAHQTEIRSQIEADVRDELEQ